MIKKWWILAILLLTMPSWLCADEGWQQVPGDGPNPRKGHSMAEINGKVYMFGGVGETRDDSSILNDLWQFSRDSNEWKRLFPLDEKPVGRYGHKAVVANNKMYIFSGMVSGGYNITDGWCYDPQANSWTPIVPDNDWPSPRIDYSMVAIGNKIYVYGGISGSMIDNQLWSYNLETNRWYRKTASDTTPQRYGHYAGVVGGKMYVIGGSNGQQLYGNILVYDPATNGWLDINVSGSAPATNGLIDIDAGRSAPVPVFNLSGISDGENLWIAGGRDGQGTDIGATWKYDVAQNIWTQQPDGPVQSYGAAVPVIDADRKVDMFLFGGENNGRLSGETWKYVPGDDPQPPTPIPTLNQWGMIFLAGLILLEGARRLRKKKVRETAAK